MLGPVPTAKPTREGLPRSFLTDCDELQCRTVYAYLARDLVLSLIHISGLAPEVVEDLSATGASLDRLAAERALSWQFDPTLVRGMGYYTGQVFEIIHPDMSLSLIHIWSWTSVSAR